PCCVLVTSTACQCNASRCSCGGNQLTSPAQEALYIRIITTGYNTMHHNQRTASTMKLFGSLALALYLSCSLVRADSLDVSHEADGLVEEGRFGFLTLDNSGAQLTFNSTSLQYAVVAGIALLLVAIILIPLLGYDVATLFSRNDNAQFADYQNYDYSSSYSQFAKRSLDAFSPILQALQRAYEQYEK
ncbi:unnamed protein product, partial [Meganyctiphanes norvegica]